MTVQMLRTMILAVVLLGECLTCLSASAAEISCYSGKTRIYHGYGHGIVLNNEDGNMMFRDDKDGALILISADCIIYQPSEFKPLYDDLMKQHKSQGH